MKREMDLIRLLLLRSESDEAPAGLEKYDEQTIVGHSALLIDEGLLEGEIVRDQYNQPCGAVIVRLTWAGHDFLDAARDDTVWNKAKETVLKPGASWTFGVLKEWLSLEIKRRLFGDSGIS